MAPPTAYNNAVELMKALGISIREINIKEACLLHFRDIGHDPEVHDVTYENVQARERTQILMDLANKHNGLVVGMAICQESALGWSTYNGDHMSMYGVNNLSTQNTGTLPRRLGSSSARRTIRKNSDRHSGYSGKSGIAAI